MADPLANPNRYHRQMLLHGIGEEGQRRLMESHALVAGCGALGSAIADTLTRAGVGTITIVDRDLVELTNLQRQILFDEDDVRDAMPKAEAARRKLARINSEITINAFVDDLNPRSINRYIAGIDVILDGLDNFETRYLLNDVAVRDGIAYIYGGAVGVSGMSMAILPKSPPGQRRSNNTKLRWTPDQSTACLRCIFPEAPPPGTSPTCDTIGVLGPAVSIIAAYQCAQAIKFLTGNLASLDRGMLSIDLWTNQLRQFQLSPGPDPACPCCGAARFDYLEGAAGGRAVSLCGRDAVQITPPASTGTMDFADLARRLQPHGEFAITPYLLRGVFRQERGLASKPIELTLFADGRAIIKGTTEPDVARTIYARYIGA